MGGSDSLRNRQTKPDTSFRSRPILSDPVEALEYMRQVLGTDPHTVIPDLDHRVRETSIQSHADGAARSRVLRSIVEQDQEQPPQRLRIAQRRTGGLRLERELQARDLRQHASLVARLSKCLGEIHRLEREFFSLGVSARKQQEIVDEA